MSKSPSIYPAPVWKNPKVLWVPPDEPDISLVRITEYEDLLLFGKYMCHSGARYQKWIIDTPIWHFYTFLDHDGYPHVTIHAKEAEWWGRAHPDDADAVTERQWDWGFGPSPRNKQGKARFWLQSTTYDRYDKHYISNCLVDGKVVIIMAAGHRDADPLWEEEKKLVDAWYETVRLGNAKQP